MGRGVHCTAPERQIIKKLSDEGKSMTEIAELMNCSKKKVFSAVHYIDKKENRGRKRATTKRFDDILARTVKKDPFLTAKELKNTLGAAVTARTIRNRLIEQDLRACSARKVPSLSQKNMKNRLIFAKRHQNRQNWNNVLWSDETKINMCGSDGKIYVRHPKNTAFDPKHTIKTVKHGGGNIMLWGCFSSSGVGPIFWIKERMFAEDYRRILESTMLPYADEEMPLKWEFMQDNDPKHKAKILQKWFQDQKISVMDWPAQSPDLNPIEHLWGHLKRRIGNFKAPNKEALWQKVQSEWYAISPSTCANLVHSMPRRCLAVLQC